ncbi:5702_t:CDS:2 [Funneliformis geosporum]|uniref:4606_t:CDS:1 n=1 Tax=Funneliformis geosporum TaxID=1117311 RepID=A0A9W4SZ08_9GLOM|nr:4606_t:CDS:2 [Funneliformis geosporum]CAI2186095.1 5702_t:CDS:2 [Funneliformis geosporum]
MSDQTFDDNSTSTYTQMGIKYSKSKIKQKPKQVLPPKTKEEFRIEEGRRFHNVETIKYFLPNDDEELDRLHLQHYMWRYLWQSNFSAPVDDLLQKEETKVLDIGCGAGSWLFELATEYPLPSFTGTDISPVIPTTIKPRNINFIKGNILDGLPFEDNSIDFVHQRLLLGAYPLDKWQGVVNELVRVLKPGGYLELMEADAELKPLGPNAKRLSDALLGLMAEKGQDPHILLKLPSFMEKNGQLEEIVKGDKFCSYDKSSGRLGQIAVENHTAFFTNIKPPLMKAMNIPSEEYDELVKAMTRELVEYETMIHTVRVYGRKKL